jgi:hypothetical protein
VVRVGDADEVEEADDGAAVDVRHLQHGPAPRRGRTLTPQHRWHDIPRQVGLQPSPDADVQELERTTYNDVVAEERDRGARRMGGGGVEDSRVSEVFVG